MDLSADNTLYNKGISDHFTILMLQPYSFLSCSQVAVFAVA